MTSKRSRKDILSVSYIGLDLAKLVKIFWIVFVSELDSTLTKLKQRKLQKNSIKFCSLP